MSREAEPKNELLYDKRTVNRSIKKGLLTRKDFDKHLKALEDVAGKGVFGGGEFPDHADDLNDDAAAE
jgi:hypothetical protein